MNSPYDKQQKLMQEIREFNRIMDWDKFHTPGNLAKSIAIEAGELLECFQWSEDYNINDLVEELADVYSYVLMMSDVLGVDINEIALEKLKTTQSKYPADKFKGISTKYNKLEEK